VRKKPAFFAGAAIAAIIACACTMPTMPKRVEVKGNLTRSLPIKLGTFNVAKLLADNLADSFADGGFEIYDMVNYNGAKAFLVAYQMKIMESFNPDDYLDEIEEQLNNIEVNDDPFSQDITIPKIESEVISDTIRFSMEEIIGPVEAQISSSSFHPAEIEFDPVPIGSGGALGIPPSVDFNNLSSIDIFPSNPGSGDYDFKAIVLKGGEIELTLQLTPVDGDVNPLDPDIDITVTGIGLATDGGSIGSPSLSDVSLNGTSPQSVVIDLAGCEIEKLDIPRLVIGGISDNFTGTEKLVSFMLTVQISLDSVRLRGAKGLQFERIEQSIHLPDATTDGLMEMMENLPPELLNAVIGEGRFAIEAELPPHLDETNTYCEGVTLEYRITIHQEPVLFEGHSFGGLSSGYGGDLEISETNWEIDLSGTAINGNDLIISDIEIHVIPFPAGANFMLSDADYDDGQAIPIKVDVALEIEELSLVRWKLEDEHGDELFSTAPTEIDFGDIGGTDLAKIIESITFEAITLGLDFASPLPPALVDRLAIKVDCPELGFANVIRVLENSTQVSSNPITFKPRKIDGTAKTVEVGLSFVPVIGGEPSEGAKYVEFGPLDVTSDQTFNIAATPSLDFDWTEAKVYLQEALGDGGSLSGTIPEEEPISLYDEVGKYMRGIKLGSNIKGKIFLAGNKGLIDIMQPNLELSATWKERINLEDPDDDDPGNWDERNEVLFSKKLTALDLHQLDGLLPGKNADSHFVYSGAQLPHPNEGMTLDNTTAIIEAFSTLSKDISLTYELAGPPVTITPAIFDIVGEDGFTALFMMIIPLELKAEEGAYFMPGDIFGDGDSDIFGRESLDEDSIFTEINVRSLGVKIDFDRTLFRGARLHIDDLLFPNGLALADGGSIGVTLSGNDLDIIRDNLIYPEIKIVFPQATDIKIPRNFMPTRITIAASASYKVDFSAIEELLGF